ncbi:PREDICTED: sequestosome-1 isoform X2 [Vollenhovia emeryi]|uniref:sequestosome-1 isoform X2 n=1 Tax=Vollenhovia emeryi TaxID=411798 RepID=UPI0005F543CD|nr:PREDICTED: sequestosome-1 isoform X2 [Vollenhovia emeryi]
MAKLSFKVYLVNKGPWTCTEVRRFGVDADVATNIVYLREKLQTIFPDLRGRSFAVTWRDNEHETVTISTNEELEIAFQEMANSDLYKLYVMLGSCSGHKETHRPEKEKEKLHHPGVICDVCDKNICGYRFKCMHCPDYDLCTDCMNYGHHSEHYMVRMAQPTDWSSYQGRRLAHHMRKFMKKAAHCKEDEGRRCPVRNKRSGCPLFNVDDEGHEEKQTKEPSAEAATEATEDPQQEATRRSFSQLMKIVEDNISNISQFLDPLGINVTVLADNEPAKNKPADSAQTKTNAQSSEDRASTSGESSVKKFPGEGKKLRDDAVQKDSAATAAAIAATATATVAAATAPTSTEQAAEAEEWTMIHRESPNISRASSISSSQTNGSTVPKQVAPSAPVAEPEKTPPNQRIYPPLPEEVKREIFHPDPKIQRAVESMMAMGFSNEGSWLTHLMVAQNGDIDKALDVIHPVRRH